MPQLRRDVILYRCFAIAEQTRGFVMDRTAFLGRMILLNLSITLFMEMVIREGSYFLGVTSDPALRFFLANAGGGVHIHSQSLVSIIMTCLATILSVQAFYTKNRGYRYLYFVVCCFVLSLAAQWVCTKIHPNYEIRISRLGFDILYGMTIKYLVFSWGRKSIVDNIHRSIKKTLHLRITQDFVLSCVKFACLTLIGLKD